MSAILLSSILLASSLTDHFSTEIVHEEVHKGYLLTQIMFHGHSYLHFIRLDHLGGGAWMHDPDCPCMKKEKKTEDRKGGIYGLDSICDIYGRNCRAVLLE